MGIFKQFAMPVAPVQDAMDPMDGVVVPTADPAGDPTPVIDANPEEVPAPADDDTTDTSTVDQSSTEAKLEEQRQQLNNEATAAITSELDPPAKVDGQDDDMAIDGTKTTPEGEVAEGDFGREVEIKDTKYGIHVDADDSEVKCSNEMTGELDLAERDVDAELDMVEQEEGAIESLMVELEQLAGAQEAIVKHGFNPTAAGIMQATGLLAGTSLDTIALESINFTNGESDESRMALEALGAKMKEKAENWSAKILSVVKNSGEKIMSVLTPLYTKIKSMIASAASATWDATKAAGRVVKAHPYKTVAGVLAAVVAVAGIVAMVGGAPGPDAKVGAMQAFLVKMKDQIGKVKFPGGTITATLASGGEKISIATKYAGEAAKSASLDVLGWTQTTVRVLGSQLDKAFNLIKHAWSTVGAKAVSLVQGYVDIVGGAGANAMTSAEITGRVQSYLHGAHPRVATAVGKTLGYATGAGYCLFVGGLIGAMFRLARFVVVAGFRMIAATLNAVLPSGRAAA